jgi:hypothetical protein
MQTLKLSRSYFEWHYGRAFSDIFQNCRNLLWFLFHFFSIGLLVRTFFSPWKRMDINPIKHEEMSDRLSRLVVNMLMRCVGVLMRSIVILIGVCALVVTACAEVTFTGIWIILPFLILAFFVRGFLLVF